MASHPLSPPARDILAQATVEENAVFLPTYQLEQTLYVEVTGHLMQIGGTWDRKVRGHLFLGDPTARLAALLDTGSTVGPVPPPGVPTSPITPKSEPMPKPSDKVPDQTPAAKAAPAPSPGQAGVRSPDPRPQAPEPNMKFTIPRKDLLAAIAAVKPAAAGSLPILNQILIVAHEKSVTLTATNLDLYIRVNTDADVSGEGKVTCRATLLADIIKAADAADVVLSTKGRNLKIECGAAKHEVTTLDPEEFPPFPRVSTKGQKTPPVQDFALEDAVFRTMLTETVFACSDDETRLVLNGCLVQLESGRLTVAGCNGFQLALSTCDTPARENQTMIIPAATVRELLRLLGGDPEKPHRLTVTAGVNLAQFSFGEITIVSKLIEGQYPDWRKILPAENLTACLPRTELLRSIGRIALVADQVRLTFSTRSLAITSEGKRGAEYLGEASDSLLTPANHAAEALFSTRYLLDILTAVPDQDLEVHLNPGGRTLFKTTGRGWRAILSPVPPAKDAAKAPASKPNPQSGAGVPPAIPSGSDPAHGQTEVRPAKAA